MTAPIDTQLREYSEFFDSLIEEVAIEDVLTERVSDGPVQPLRARTPAVRRGWLVAVGAAAAVALIIGLVGLFRSTGTEPAPPAISPPPITESIAPQLRSSGVIATPLGDVDWSYHTGPSGPGSMLFERPDGELAMWLTEDEVLWTSADGAEWVGSPLGVPVESAMFSARVVGDSYWLFTAGPSTLWQSRDFRSWEQIDLSGIPLPETFNVEWVIQLTALAQAESGVVASWTATPTPPLEAWYPELAETHTDLHLVTIGRGPGAVYPVRGTRIDGVDETVAMLRVEPFGESGSAWQTYDAEGGREIAYFAFDTGGAIVGDPFDYSVGGLLLIDDGTTEAVDAPWSADGGHLSGLIDVDGRLLATQDRADGATPDLWESRDGRSWDMIGVMPGTEPSGIEAEGGVAYAFVAGADESLWFLRDGGAWVRAPIPPGGSASAVRMFGDGYAGWAGGGLWVSLDGIEWSRVDLAELGIAIDVSDPLDGVPVHRVGDRLVLRFWPGDQPGGNEPGTQFVVLEMQP